jgi:Flp pilus assembly protein TadD
MALGKATEALPFFQQSLRLNPRFRPYTKYKFMGLANIHLGQDGEAVSFLNKAVVGSPNDPTANFALASALAMLGREDEARVVLGTYMKLAPGQTIEPPFPR